jgi:hypothetical protein
MNLDAFVPRPKGDKAAPTMTADAWPKPLEKPAYHGILGEIVSAIAPETEADPAAILIQVLVMLGNVIVRHIFESARTCII